MSFIQSLLLGNGHFDVAAVERLAPTLRDMKALQSLCLSDHKVDGCSRRFRHLTSFDCCDGVEDASLRARGSDSGLIDAYVLLSKTQCLQVASSRRNDSGAASSITTLSISSLQYLHLSCRHLKPNRIRTVSKLPHPLFRRALLG